MMLRARIPVRRAIRTVAGLALATAAIAGWRWGTGNVGVVEPGEIYRSAQLDGDTLGRLIRAKGIRTVLNLRGPNPETAWYRAERAATIEAGATLIDIPMASDYWMTRDQAKTVIETLDSCERPVLIHCQFGAERTGLVAVIAELIRPGGSLAEARAELSPYYLFLPIQDGVVVRGHLRQYERWLGLSGREHSAATFRRWIAEWYVPGTPNRSQWPYDPYPLRVVTRPTDAPTPR